MHKSIPFTKERTACYGYCHACPTIFQITVKIHSLCIGPTCTCLRCLAMWGKLDDFSWLSKRTAMRLVRETADPTSTWRSPTLVWKTKHTIRTNVMRKKVSKRTRIVPGHHSSNTHTHTHTHIHTGTIDVPCTRHNQNKTFPSCTLTQEITYIQALAKHSAHSVSSHITHTHTHTHTHTQHTHDTHTHTHT